MRDRIGLAFFTFATVVSAMLAWERPTTLAWLVTIHNGTLAVIYTQRKPAHAYDRKGLLLGLAAALLPLATPYPERPSLFAIALGIASYGLILWSLLILGTRFGIAPADRGLVTHGPYRLVRHPMYLGEFMLRLSLILTAPDQILAFGMLGGLFCIQAWRILREECIIVGYALYANQVSYRLLPGIW